MSVKVIWIDRNSLGPGPAFVPGKVKDICLDHIEVTTASFYLASQAMPRAPDGNRTNSGLITPVRFSPFSNLSGSGSVQVRPASSE